MARGGGFNITVTVDDEQVLAGLRSIRSTIRQDVKVATGRAAERHVRPLARRGAPRFLAHTVVTRSNTGGAVVTTDARGKKRAIFVLLNDGGVARKPIYPKKKKALAWGGRFTANVTTPRHFTGKRFLETAVKLGLPAYTDSVESQLQKVIQSRLTGGSVFGTY